MTAEERLRVMKLSLKKSRQISGLSESITLRAEVKAKGDSRILVELLQNALDTARASKDD